MRSSVVLPEPEGPSSAVSEPSGTSSETSSSAVKLPKDLLMDWIEMDMGKFSARSDAVAGSVFEERS